MKGTFSALGLYSVLLTSIFVCALPVQAANESETGELLVKLLQAGRSVISAHQELINDASKGNKGFTPDYMGEKMIEKYRETTKIDLRQPNSTPYNKPPTLNFPHSAPKRSSQESLRTRQPG